MTNQNTIAHIFVLYDSIENSVFESQVLAPLLALKKKCPTKKILLISFEKRNFSQEFLNKRIPSDHIEIIILRKFLFLGFASLYPALYQLKRILAPFEHYDLVARGPLAGYLCLYAHKKKCAHSLTIQIRGLLAQEYRYEHRHEKNWLLKKLHACRTSLYEHVEKKAYAASSLTRVHYEVVSESLKEYVHTMFGLAQERMLVAHLDLPPTPSSDQVQTWRCATRTTLGLSATKFVYCYNGSLKSWQCPEKIISFFQNTLAKNTHSFLLILTPDAHLFEKLLQNASIAQQHYKILSVPYKDIFRYLAACDTGIIFREEHILNWISRPTKVLEYYAVGLPVIHNTTVALLTKKGI